MIVSALAIWLALGAVLTGLLLLAINLGRAS